VSRWANNKVALFDALLTDGGGLSLDPLFKNSREREKRKIKIRKQETERRDYWTKPRGF
jgi:hypothetical protein